MFLCYRVGKLVLRLTYPRKQTCVKLVRRSSGQIERELMETNVPSTKITRSEWFWVIKLAFIWLFLSFVASFIIQQNLDSDWVFMGISVNPMDGASYLSKIDYGMDGHWGYSLQHAPIPHDEAYIFLFYVLLGHLASIFGLSALIMFQTARVAMSLFMWLSVYWLSAQLWPSSKPRRQFTLIASFATGLGWLPAIFISNKDLLPPDLIMPEAFMYYSVFTNPHFPLSIGCMALASGFIIRDISQNEKKLSWSTILVLVGISIVLALTQPPALAILLAALGLLGLWQTIETRRIPLQTSLLFSALFIPAIPIWLYFLNVFSNYDVWVDFNSQNETPSPNVFVVFMSFSILLILSIPAWLQIRRSPLTTQTKFMLVWTVFVFVAIYVPYALQRRFLIGITLPLAYFGVEAIQSYWSHKLKPQRQRLLLFFLILLVLPTYIFSLGTPMIVASNPENAVVINGIVLPKDYVTAFEWLDEHGQEDEVVLASPPVDLWIPGKTQTRAVYGHKIESVSGKKGLEQVEDFYTGASCNLLTQDTQKFEIDYVIWGPAEDLFRADVLDGEDDTSAALCLSLLQANVPESQIEQFGKVSIFVLDDTIRATLANNAQTN